MKPKKKKAGKQLSDSEIARIVTANDALCDSFRRAGINPWQVPADLMNQTRNHLLQGKPLVFASKGSDFIICDPRTYAQMVGKTGG